MRLILSALLLCAFATPALATGGMTCRTAGPRPVEVNVGFGHVPGAPIIQSRLIDDGRNVPVSAPQWWLDDREMRVVLVSPEATRQELMLKVVRNGSNYDGSIWRGGKRRWVRCRES